jgi:hypothetical protein
MGGNGNGNSNGGGNYRCSRICGSGRLEEFWPFEEQPGVLSSEVHCGVSDGGSDRWWTVYDVSDQGRCDERGIDYRTTHYTEARPLNPSSAVRGGLFTRYQANFATGNGQAWVGTSPSANNLGLAEPWFMDRPPVALEELNTGNAIVVVLIAGSMVGQLTPAGFITQNQDMGIAAVVQEQGALFTTKGELISIFDQQLKGKVAATIPEKAELHLVLADHANGDREWVASVDDQLFATPVRKDGRLATLLPIVRPSPGSIILGMSARHVPGREPELYAFTRASVFRVYLDSNNRWRSTEVKLGSTADLLKVWVTPDNRARVGDATGSVYSLPSGLLLAAPPKVAVDRGEAAQDFVHACGRDLVLFETEGYLLGAPTQGVAGWSALGLKPDSFKGGRMFATSHGMFVFGAQGDGQKLNCTP